MMCILYIGMSMDIYIYTLSRQPLGWDDDFFPPKTMDSTEESSATLVLAHAKIGDSGPGF